MLLPLMVAVPCAGGVPTATLAVPFPMVSLDVTASGVAVFQGTVTESSAAAACGWRASLLPPQAVSAARQAAAMAVGIHRVENLIIQAPEMRVPESCRSDQYSLSAVAEQ